MASVRIMRSGIGASACTVAVALVVILAVAAAVQAAVIVSEPFDYTAASGLSGKAGGTGWDVGGGAWWGSGWYADSNYTIASSGLSYPSGAPGTGNALQIAGTSQGTFRSLASATNFTNETVYVSWLERVTDASGTGNRALELGHMAGGNVSTDCGFAIYNGVFCSNRWGSAGTLYGTTPISANTTYLLVAKIVLSNTAFTSTLYVNPTGAEGSNTPEFTVTGGSWNNLNGVALFFGQAGTLDEFSMSRTWSDVLPEPASLVLLGIGVAGLLARRRR